MKYSTLLSDLFLLLPTNTAPAFEGSVPSSPLTTRGGGGGWQLIKSSHINRSGTYERLNALYFKVLIMSLNGNRILP